MALISQMDPKEAGELLYKKFMAAHEANDANGRMYVATSGGLLEFAPEGAGEGAPLLRRAGSIWTFFVPVQLWAAIKTENPTALRAVAVLRGHGYGGRRRGGRRRAAFHQVFELFPVDCFLLDQDTRQQLKQGTCSAERLADLKALGATMQVAAKCGLGQTSPSAFLSIVGAFADDVTTRPQRA